MGVGAAIAIGVSLAISTAMVAYTMNQKQDDLKNKLDLHEITKSEEGAVIPIVYGRTQVFGHIDYYGNVRMKSKGGGGKGGGGAPKTKEIVVDAHIVLAQVTTGSLILHGIYKDKDSYTPDATLIFNDGTTTTYYEYATYANHYPGVSHIMLKDWHLGENVNNIPSLSFDVSHEKDIGGGFTEVIDNPANVIEDILSLAGESVDSTTFSDMETFFNGLGLKVNHHFDSQSNLSEILQLFAKTYDIYIYKQNGLWYIGSWGDTTVSATDLPFSDIKDFKFRRKSYLECLTDVVGTFRDSRYTRRSARLRNEAVASLAGKENNKSISLDMLNTQEQVVYRLSQMLKRESYPLSECTFTTNLKYYDLHVGSVINLKSVFDVRDIKTQVTKITRDFQEGKIEITAMETVDNVDLVAPSEIPQTLYVDEDYTIHNLVAKVMKMDYYIWRGFSPNSFAVLVLAEQYTGKEYEYDVYSSQGGTNYIKRGTLDGFAYKSTLQADYSSDTQSIDDDIGILTNHSDLTYPLDTLSRDELFTSTRIVVIDSEIMKFQKAVQVGANLKLLGVVRDNKQNHTAGADIWIADIRNHVIEIPRGNNNVLIRLCPRNVRTELDYISATDHTITDVPALFPIGRMVCVRSGSSIVTTVAVSTQQNEGCGCGNPDHIIYPEVLGILSYDTGGSETEFTGITFTITTALAVTITVTQRYLGYEVSKSVYVGTTDGTYT